MLLIGHKLLSTRTLNWPFWYCYNSDTQQTYSTFSATQLKYWFAVFKCTPVCGSVYTYVCFTIDDFCYIGICISFFFFLPWLSQKLGKKCYSVLRKQIQLQNTINLSKLSSEIIDLASPGILCTFASDIFTDKNPSPYFAALSLLSPVLQVCNVWAQFLGEFPICLCACYLWQRTVPGQQL